MESILWVRAFKRVLHACTIAGLLAYICDTLLHNDEVREELDQTKSRHQDAAKVFQDIMRTQAGSVDAAGGEALVKRMFSPQRVLARNLISGIINFAKNATSEILDLMISFPFEVPAFFFKKCVADFCRLSGLFYANDEQAFRGILLAG